MIPPFRAILPTLVALALCLSGLAAPRSVSGQVTDDGASPDEVLDSDTRPRPPADLSAEQIAILAAAAGELLPLLPHEPEGQPGSAIDGLAILGSVIDSVGGRGAVALSREEGQAIASAVEARGLRAIFCGADCPGRYGDAAVTFHLPSIDGDEANVRIRTTWAIGQLPSLPPDRVLFRADELRLRRSAGSWELVAHEKLSEEIKLVAAPMPSVVE